MLIKEQAAAAAAKALWTFTIQVAQPESLLIDKDSAAEWFSHMSALAVILFEELWSHSIFPNLRGVVCDVFTPISYTKCASRQAWWCD